MMPREAMRMSVVAWHRRSDGVPKYEACVQAAGPSYSSRGSAAQQPCQWDGMMGAVAKRAPVPMRLV